MPYKDTPLSSEEEAERVREYLRRLEELPPVPTHDPNLPIVTASKDNSDKANQTETTRLAEDVDSTMSDPLYIYYRSEDDDEIMASSSRNTTATSDKEGDSPETDDDNLLDKLVPTLSKIVKEDNEEIYKILKEKGILKGIKSLSPKYADSNESSPIPDEVF